MLQLEVRTSDASAKWVLMLLDLGKTEGAQERIDRLYEASRFRGVGGGDYEVAAVVALAFDLYKDRSRYRLVGRIQTSLALVCGRCLEPFTIPVDTPFDLRYLPQSENAGEGEFEVEEDDLTTAYYREERIDLGELLREQFYLALPMKPLCRASCHGLCFNCGTNLNLGACACAPTWAEPRLAGLRALLRRDEDS